MAVQAGCQAEGQAGPAAQEDIEGRECQGEQYEEQKAALEERQWSRACGVLADNTQPPHVEPLQFHWRDLLQGYLALDP